MKDVWLDPCNNLSYVRHTFEIENFYFYLLAKAVQNRLWEDIWQEILYYIHKEPSEVKGWEWPSKGYSQGFLFLPRDYLKT